MIPEEFKKLARSPEIYDKAELVGNKFDLHIDRIGELDAEIRDVLCGVNKASEFSKNIKERLEIDQETAEKITREINKEVFDVIKSQLQSQTSKNNEQGSQIANINTIEKVGGFEVEPPENLPSVTEKDVESKDSIISSLENPTPVASPILKSPTNTEPMIDHLLKNPVVQTVEKKVVEKTINKIDPYREPIK